MHRNFDGHLSSFIPYTPTTKSNDVCFRFDSISPIHCKVDFSCSYDPIQLPKRITDDGNITVAFNGWLDPFPTNGRQDQASGVQHFDIAVHKMSDSGDSWRMEDGSIQSKKIYANQTDKNVACVLENEPALYGITVTAVDIANNVKKARRIIYYDKSSKLLIDHNQKLFFDSASPDTNYTWQTNHKQICLSWIGRYYNDHNIHSSNNALKPVQQDVHGFYKDIYEQTSGVLPVKGTQNVYGIVAFYYRYKLNENTFSTKATVPDFTKQRLCKTFTPRDGQAYTIEVQSKDLKSQVLTEEKTVYIDRSAPDINNIWLVKEGHRKLYVHNSTELFKMDIEFDVQDLHSGIHSIRWTFSTTLRGAELGQGAIGVQRLNVRIRDIVTND